MSPSVSQKCSFYAELAKLLEAGFGIREAAGVMSETSLPAAQAAILGEILRGLGQGKSIAEAMGADEELVSTFERGIIGSGERGGRLAPAMRHLSSYFGMLAATRREMLRGLVHPFIVLHLGAFIATVPAALMRGESDSTRIAMDFLVVLLAAYILAAGLFLGIRWLLDKARTSASLDRMLGRIPMVGKARENLALAGFCRIYHIGLLAGIPMRETVRTAAAAARSGAVLEAGARLERVVADGNALGPAMLEEGVFPKAFARSYATGEAAGTLDKDLEHWSNLFQTEAEAGARTLSVVIPKILYLCATLYVAWKIVGFYQSYYGTMLDELQ